MIEPELIPEEGKLFGSALGVTLETVVEVRSVFGVFLCMMLELVTGTLLFEVDFGGETDIGKLS